MTNADDPKDPKDQAATTPAAPDPALKPHKKSVEAQHPKFGPQKGKFSNKQVQQRPAIFRGGPRGR